VLEQAGVRTVRDYAQNGTIGVTPPLQGRQGLIQMQVANDEAGEDGIIEIE